MNWKNIIVFISLASLVALSLGGIHAADETVAMEDASGDELSSQVAIDASDKEALSSQILSDASADELSSQITVDADSMDDITRQIEKANDGDTIDLGENKEYNIGNDSISITKKITLKGSNVTISSQSTDGGLRLEADGICIQGITFASLGESLEDNESSCRMAIYASESCNLLIDSCQFINFECAVDIRNSSGAIIRNCLFNATGATAIRLYASTDAQIINNTFHSRIKNGLMIESGLGEIFIENNTFANATWKDNQNQTFTLFEEEPSEYELYCEDQTYLTTTGGISNEVRQLAKKIVGKTKGIEAVKKIANWVSKNIAHEKAPGFYQSPLTTLQRKKGNCCCHSELFLQMCDCLGYTKQFDMYIVHVGNMKFGQRHFFTIIGEFCVDTTKKNPWGKGGFGKRHVYSITKYPYLPLIREY